MLTPKRLDTLGAALPQLSPLLPSVATLRASAGRVAVLASSQAAAEWEGELEAQLPTQKLTSWFTALDGAATAARLGRAIDAAAALLSSQLQLPARLAVALSSSAAAVGGPLPASGTGATASGTTDSAANASTCPKPWPSSDLAAVVALVDAVMAEPTLRVLGALSDKLTEPERVEACVAARDRVRPAVGASSPGSSDTKPMAAADSSHAPTGGLPLLVKPALVAAVRHGIAARSVRALAAALDDPGGIEDAAKLVDAIAAPPGTWSKLLAALPAALRLGWSFHVQIAFPRAR